MALLSNGTEAIKGTPELVEVHESLAGEGGTGLKFVGNIEGTDVMESVADVVVMDGFTGNVTLKLIEGVSGRTLRAIRDGGDELDARQAWRLAAAPGGPGAAHEIDPEGPGGAYMLGLRQLGVIAHGRFTRNGFARAIEVAAHGVEQDVVGRTQAALQEAGALHIRAHHRASGTEASATAAPGDSSSPSGQPTTVMGQ